MIRVLLACRLVGALSALAQETQDPPDHDPFGVVDRVLKKLRRPHLKAVDPIGDHEDTTTDGALRLGWKYTCNVEVAAEYWRPMPGPRKRSGGRVGAWSKGPGRDRLRWGDAPASGRVLAIFGRRAPQVGG